MKELELIEAVKEILKEDVEVPAGLHDAAIAKLGDYYLVLTCDTVSELTDFPEEMKAEEFGHLALAVTLSDLAACGAKPLFFLNSICLKEADVELFRKILIGMKKLAEKYDVKVVGGDIDFGKYITIAGFAVGVADRVIVRTNAKPGEKVFITDLTGKAELCLRLLKKGLKRKDLPFDEKLYTPEPRINEGLIVSKFASAITDVSDSLAISLYNMAEKVKILIDLDSIDLSELEGYGEDPEELFLYGGGDYELVFTSEDSEIGFEIGRVYEGSGVFAKKGNKVSRVERRGYFHF
ncbi:MAG: thiamine-phosphate kinase [Archaeoglobaceae archaeon]|nr:thiamine-phosphate kinase [Archaeoglobaceae archaeon]MCX8152015.1 thiamine-phosphate kinase [Archaeoglobaceae archaeon]MDW8013404.1 thiamine-phosphate kinase [Archaeoglobaceae archaeon]